MRVLAFLFCLVTAAGLAQDDDPIELRHVGNMGVLISQGDRKVLIDAVFDTGYDGVYRRPTDGDLDAIRTGTGEFAGVDAVMATHIHADHASPRRLAELLAAQPGAIVYSTPQVRDAVLDIAGDDFADRVIALDTFGAAGPGPSVDRNGINIDGRRVFHEDEIQNTAFAVTFGTTTLLHLGDVDGDIGRVDFSIWDDVDVDVLLYPFWIANDQDGRDRLDLHWPDAHRVALHIPMIWNREEAQRRYGAEHVLADPGDRILIRPVSR